MTCIIGQNLSNPMAEHPNEPSSDHDETHDNEQSPWRLIDGQKGNDSKDQCSCRDYREAPSWMKSTVPASSGKSGGEEKRDPDAYVNESPLFCFPLLESVIFCPFDDLGYLLNRRRGDVRSCENCRRATKPRWLYPLADADQHSVAVLMVKRVQVDSNLSQCLQYRRVFLQRAQRRRIQDSGSSYRPENERCDTKGYGQPPSKFHRLSVGYF